MTLLFSFFIAHSSCLAQDAKDRKIKPESKGSRETFNKIQQLVRKGNWNEATKFMTKNAQDEIIVSQVIGAIGLTKMELPVPIPQLEDTIDDIDNVLTEYRIDTLNIDTSSMFKFSFSMGDDADESEDKDLNKKENVKSQMAKQSEKILKHVDASGKRLEILSELWDAKKSSPFSMSPLNGKVKQIEKESDDVHYLEVSVSPAESDGGTGVSIQVMTPPTALRMIKKDGLWKLDGNDEKRTENLMKEFQKNSPTKPSGPIRQDF